MEERYNANKTGNKAESCTTPTSILNKEKEKLFQKIMGFSTYKIILKEYRNPKIKTGFV